MQIMIDQKSALEMPVGRVSQMSSIRQWMVGDRGRKWELNKWS